MNNRDEMMRDAYDALEGLKDWDSFSKGWIACEQAMSAQQAVISSPEESQ